MYNTHEKECLNVAVETGVICAYIYMSEIQTYHRLLYYGHVFFYMLRTQIYRHKYIYIPLYLLHTFHIEYVFLEALYVPQLQQTRG